MRRALAIVLCTAGCFSDRGLLIEIETGGRSAARVELFVGQTCNKPDACEVVGPDATCTLAGVRYDRDAALSSDTAVTGGVARFHLEAGTDTALPMAVAVGLDAAGNVTGTALLRDLRISPTQPAIARATLVAANTSASDRAQVWSDKRDPSRVRCALVEHLGAADPPRVMISPRANPDCSESAATEPSALVCGAPGVGAICYLGEPTCDAAGHPAGCDRAPLGNTCVANDLCAAPPGKAAEAFRTSVTPVICDIPVAKGRPCTETAALAQVADLCANPKLATLANLTVFAQSITVGNFELDAGQSSCTTQITIKPANAGAQLDADLTAALRLASNRGAAVVVPLRLHPAVIDQCPPAQLPAACRYELAAGDGLMACVAKGNAAQ